VRFRPVEDGDPLGPAFRHDERSIAPWQAEHVTDVRMTEVNPVYSLCKLTRQAHTLPAAVHRMASKVSHLVSDTNPVGPGCTRHAICDGITEPDLATIKVSDVSTR
jgi:hypothetical protein